MSASIPTDQLDHLIARFGAKSFTTKEFCSELRAVYPKTWDDLEAEYGSGGKGAGRHYSVFSRVSQELNTKWKAGLLSKKMEWEDAPDEWGSPVIRRWNVAESSAEAIFPEEIPEEDHYPEGSTKQVLVNKYERNPAARAACIKHYKALCAVCKFNFEERYGDLGAGFIHVHHKIPLSSIAEDYEVDPIKDLVPVCPNCHSMLHRTAKVLTVEELQALLR
jgi:predicted HNH restriction endonuclease